MVLPESKFKVGDTIQCLPGGVDIWVKEGKIYEVLGIKFEDSTLDQPNCHCPDGILKGRPSRFYVEVIGELNNEIVTILEDCFEKI